jgi:hypothetical protein
MTTVALQQVSSFFAQENAKVNAFFKSQLEEIS